MTGRYGMVENIDDNCGLLVHKLDEWKARDNTLAIRYDKQLKEMGVPEWAPESL